MSGRQHDIHSKPVPEAEVAADLGFKTIYEMRRWSTDLGMQVAELEYALSQAKQESTRFRNLAMSEGGLLDRIEPILALVLNNEAATVDSTALMAAENIRKLLLALRVVRQREIDWGGKTDEWLRELAAEQQKEIDDALNSLRADAMTDDEINKFLD